MKLDILTALNAERAARRAAIVITNVENGKQRFVKAADIGNDPLRSALAEHLRTGKSGMADSAEGRVFLTVYVPAPQLVITGAVHISQALAPIGNLLGYDVTIVDPRTAFASLERFPDVKVIAEWPDQALPRLNVDRYTAFVALTHDPKIDDPALTPRAVARLFLYRRAGLAKNPCAAGRAAQGAGSERSRYFAHSCTDRARHRRGIARGNRGGDHGADYRTVARSGRDRDLAVRALQRPPP